MKKEDQEILSLKNGLLNESGFSLIEVVISTVLMGFMTLAIYKVTNNSFRTKESIIGEDRQYIQMISALHRIDTDFSQIYSPLFFSAKYAKEAQAKLKANDPNKKAIKFTPSEQFPVVSVSGLPVPMVESEDKSTLIFLANSNRRRLQDVKQSRLNWVRFSLRSSEKKEGQEKAGEYELVRQTSSIDPYALDLDWNKVKEQVLLKGIKTLVFEYWSTKGQKFVDRIRELPEEDKYSLRGIRIKIEIISSQGASLQTTRTFRPLFPYFDTVKDEQAKLIPVTQNPNDSDDDD